MGLENTDLQDLTWNDGTENMGGTTQRWYFIPLSWLQKPLPKVPASPANLDAASVISDSFLPVSGKGFMKLYATAETSGVTSEPQGESDGKSFINKYNTVFPGNGPRALGFARYVNNTSGIIVAEEADGTLRVIGSELYPAKATAITPVTGVTTAERKQVAMEFSAPASTPAPIYTGTHPENLLYSSSSSASASAV